MIISLFQMQPVSGDVEANLARIETAAKAAAQMGASLILAPELATSGYALGEWFAEGSEGRDGRTVTTLSRIASELDIAVCVGFPERDGKTVYNSAVLARPDGSREFYRKGHLYGPAERAAFHPGSEGPQVFDLCGIRTGMLICYDVEFPESVRTLAMAGAELILVPTALPNGPISRRVADVIVPARAFENGVFVAYADLCGSEKAVSYCGRSAIIAPDGEEIARAGHGETLLVAEIDPQGYAECREENPYLTERRPELYRIG